MYTATTGTLSDDTRINARRNRQHQSHIWTPDEVRLSVTGTIYAIAEIGEIISWLHAALSLTVGSDGISIHEPFIDLNFLATQAFMESGVDATCRIQSSLKGKMRDIQTTPSAQGECWQNILGNTVCVHGYPTTRRPMRQTGMEVSLKTMISLANARKLMCFKGIFCIKGYCSLIVPTERKEDTIFWHLSTNKDGSYMPYTGQNHGENGLNNDNQCLQGLSLHELETSTHVLGWASNVESLAGKDNFYTWHVFLDR